MCRSASCDWQARFGDDPAVISVPVGARCPWQADLTGGGLGCLVGSASSCLPSGLGSHSSLGQGSRLCVARKCAMPSYFKDQCWSVKLMLALLYVYCVRRYK